MAAMCERTSLVVVASLALLLQVLWSSVAQAMPEFARKYNMSCAACHAAFPRLNSFGEQFAANNMRLSNWRDSTLDTGDERLALPSYPPLAIRAQAYAQARTGKSVDPFTGETVASSNDFQAPYLVKLLSSAPLSDQRPV